MASPSCSLNNSEAQSNGQTNQDHLPSVSPISAFESLLEQAPSCCSSFLPPPADHTLLTSPQTVTELSDSLNTCCPLISAVVASPANNSVQPTDKEEDVSNTSYATGASLSSLPTSSRTDHLLLPPKDEVQDVEEIQEKVEQICPLTGSPHPLPFPNPTSSPSYVSTAIFDSKPTSESIKPDEDGASSTSLDHQSSSANSCNTGTVLHAGLPCTTPLLASLASCTAVSSPSFPTPSTTLPSTFGLPMNPFVGSLPSPFLAHNVFLPHPLPSPLLDNVIHLTNSWRLLNACQRWSSDLPSSGLPLPTPTFPTISPPTPTISPPTPATHTAMEEQDSASTRAGHIRLENFPLSPSPQPEGGQRGEEGAGEGAADPSEGGRCCVRWHEQSARLCAHLASLPRTADTADLTLSGGGGAAPVPAHRVVMAAASPVIRDALQGIRADQAAVVLVPRAAAAALEALVSLCYTGTTSLPQRHLADVLKIAEELEIAHLRIVPPNEDSSSSTSIFNQNIISNNDRNTSNPTTTTNETHFNNTTNVNSASDTNASSSCTTVPSYTTNQSQQPVDYRISPQRAPSPQHPLHQSAPPSPPSVFTFPPLVPRHSPPSYTAALASSLLAKAGAGSRVGPGGGAGRGEKRRPITPDIAHSQVKKVKTEATFLPGEVQQTFPFSPTASSSNRSLPPGCAPSSTFSSSLLSGPPQSAPATLRDGALLHTIRSSSLCGGSGTGARVLLWKFLLQLLHDARFCPVYIRWLDRSNGVFRIMESDMVAQLWGIARKNSNMNYEKMSRGMRTYYKRGILYHIDGTKLIYKFNTSDMEVQNHMRYFELTQQAMEQDNSNDSSNLLAAGCSSSAPLLMSAGGTLTSAAKLDPIRRTGANDELPVSTSSSSLLLSASFLCSSSQPCFPPPSKAGPSITTAQGPSLLSQTLTAGHPTNSNSSSSGSSIPGHGSNNNKTLSKLELFGLNKPRSNSIPNFQTSARFASFFGGGNSSNNNNSSSSGSKTSSKMTSKDTTSPSSTKQSSVVADGDKSGTNSNKFRSNLTERNKQYPSPLLPQHSSLQVDPPTAQQQHQQGQQSPRLQREVQQGEKLCFVFPGNVDTLNGPY